MSGARAYHKSWLHFRKEDRENRSQMLSGHHARPSLNLNAASVKENIYYCKNFVALPISQRLAEIRNHKLCVNCLRSSSHASSKCTSSQCKVCQAKHNTLLHISSAADPSTSNTDKEGAPKATPPPSLLSNCFSAML